MAPFTRLFTLALLLAASAYGGSREDMARSTVRCQDPADCPAAVGSFFTVWSDDSSRLCTATLVGPDLALTAGHCLDRSLHRSGASCRGAAMVILPAYSVSNVRGEVATMPMERLECDSVVSVVEPPVSNFVQARDYALVRLASRSTRTPLIISRGGFLHDSSPSIYYVHDTTSAGPANSEIRRLSGCSVRNGSLYQPYAISAESPVAFMARCELVPQGASGAPVLSAGGAVIGTINGYQNSFSQESTAAATPMELEEGFRIRVGLGGNFATNLACLGSISTGLLPRTDDACAPDNHEILTEFVQQRRELARIAVLERDRQLSEARHRAVAQAEAALPGSRWSVREKITSGVVSFIPVPLCRPTGVRAGRQVSVTAQTVTSEVDSTWRPTVTTWPVNVRVQFDRNLPACESRR